MGFNGIGGFLNSPGQIPWEFVVLYFAVALGIAFVLGRKTGGVKMFTTVDLVYIGIGSAFAVVWEFYISGFIGRVLPNTPFVDIGFWGRIFTLFIIAALVRKVGAGMSTLFIFNLLSDIISYGFSGEPIYTIYEMFTYGLLIDVFIAATGGNIFGVLGSLRASRGGKVKAVMGGSGESVNTSPGGYRGNAAPDFRKNITSFLFSTNFKTIAEGAVLGALLAFPDALLYRAFFSPLLYGGVVSWAKVAFNLETALPGNIIIGALAALAAVRIVKAVGQ